MRVAVQFPHVELQERNAGSVRLSVQRLVDGHKGELGSERLQAGFGDAYELVIGSIYDLLCYGYGGVKIILMIPDRVIEDEGIVRC